MEQEQEEEEKEEDTLRKKILVGKFEDVPRSGLVSWFRYKNFKPKTLEWKSIVNDYEMTVISGKTSIQKMETPGFGTYAMMGAVSGTALSQVTFGEVIKKDFTICSLTRYTGSQQGRILTGSYGKDYSSTKGNWFHGHWEGKIGVAHYEGWFTEYENQPDALDDSYK